VLHEVTGSETALLVMLFPQLAGLDVLRAEELRDGGAPEGRHAARAALRTLPQL
jgi:hypothetical protein